MSRSRALILLVLAVVAIASWWWKSSVPQAPVDKPRALQQSDYFMTDFHLRQFDRNGRVHYRMRGRRLEHYPADDSTVIEQPRLSVATGQNGGPWEISARHARAGSRELDEVVFKGAVDMHRPAAAGALRLNTEHLIVKPGAKKLNSPRRITLAGPGARIEGVNLQADLQSGVVTLDNVRSRYVP